MLKKAITILFALAAILGVSVAAYGVEKGEFVSKCMMNGRDYKPCACTYNALPDLPDAYADLAVSWAHDPPGDYRMTFVKTLATDLIPGSGGRKTKYGMPQSAEEGSYFGKLVRSVGTSAAMKWVVSLIPGIDGGASIVVTTATKATGKWGYARYVFDQHCDQRLATLSNELSRYAGQVTDATTQTLTTVGNGISEATETVTEATKNAAKTATEATKTTIDYLGRAIGLDGE